MTCQYVYGKATILAIIISAFNDSGILDTWYMSINLININSPILATEKSILPFSKLVLEPKTDI